EKLLKLFTFLELDEIGEIVKGHFLSPEKREAQKRLAWEVTSIVHGEDAAKTAQRASEILFGGTFEPSELDSSMLEALCGEVPSADLDSPVPLPLVDLLAVSGICKSKGEAKRLLKGGGVYVNGERVNSEDLSITDKEILHGKHIFLRLGKKRFYMVNLH
nr:S4 domain-containing protein [Synergistales bacterium]